MTAARTIYVYAAWVGLPEHTLVGKLRVQRSKNEEQFDFTYDESWLRSGYTHTLDPELQLFEVRNIRVMDAPILVCSSIRHPIVEDAR